jgi:hypothetical protein
MITETEDADTDWDRRSLVQQTWITTVPVPACPGLGWYPGSTLTTTMWTVLPEIRDPFLAARLVTMTPMYCGSGPFGGGAVLPGLVLQLTPQLG